MTYIEKKKKKLTGKWKSVYRLWTAAVDASHTSIRHYNLYDRQDPESLIMKERRQACIAERGKNRAYMAEFITLAEVVMNI